MNAKIGLLNLCILGTVMFMNCATIIRMNKMNSELENAHIVLTSYQHAQLAHVAETGNIGQLSELVFEAPGDSKFIKYYEISEGIYCAELIADISGCKKGAKLFAQVTSLNEAGLQTDNDCLNKKLPEFVKLSNE